MRIAFYGSSLLSSYWNGAATYYRGLLWELAALGHEIDFFEPDAFDRRCHRDIDPPEWARVHVYAATQAGVQSALAAGANADVLVKASGVGVFDTELLNGVLSAPRRDALRLFWDVDAPATLAGLTAGADPVLSAALPRLDAIFTYGGGAPVVQRYLALGARHCIPIYNALDRATHHPVQRQPRFTADLSLLANRLPDREARIDDFFFSPAVRLPQRQFLLGGSGWSNKALPPNVRILGHVSTNDHNALNCSALAVLNVARDSMAQMGFSPATRIFEAAGAGACLVTDSWEGIELFLKPDEEVLVARDGQDVVAHLCDLTPERAFQIGQRARLRILADHTYDKRAIEVDRHLAELATVKVGP